jgi:hypothetical protein
MYYVLTAHWLCLSKEEPMVRSTTRLTIVLLLLAVACSGGGGNDGVKADASQDACEELLQDGGGELSDPDSPQVDEDLSDKHDAGQDVVAPPDGEPPPDVPIGPDLCQPACEGQECGPDGCGGSCGDCDPGDECLAGQCEPVAGCTAIEQCHPKVCDVASGLCVSCTQDVQCAEIGELCWDALGLCVVCETDEQCEPGFGCETGLCVELFCPEAACPEEQVCNLATQKCVDCLSEEDCPPNNTCEENACVPPPTCDSSKDCALDEVCDKATSTCVECLLDADCPDGYRCTLKECIEILFCGSDKDCKEYDKVCDKIIGECVDCLSDVDCADDHFCVAKVCEEDVCDQAAAWPACVGETVGQCAANGSSLTILDTCVVGEYCDEAQCKPWVCQPDALGCDGNTAFKCNDVGSAHLWELPCGEGKACSGGECKPVVCQPNEVKCLDMLTLVKCSADGVEFEPLPCGDMKYCDVAGAACVPWKCVPGSKSCQGQVAMVCNEWGDQWGSPVDCTTFDMVCVPGLGECQVCDPACGTKECGPDACGATCGTCLAGEACMGGYCFTTTCPQPRTGKSKEAFLCGLDYCLPETVVAASVSTPMGDDVAQMFDVAANYGTVGNALKPWAGSSVVIMASGNIGSQQHSDQMPPQGSIDDPWAPEADATAHDVVDGKLELTAPPGVTGFSVDFIMLSKEPDAQNQMFNDAFYIALKAPITTGGVETVINFVSCPNPANYKSFTSNGVSFCFFCVLAGLMEPKAALVTNITGTGFPSSTGWYRTTWTIQPGEAFSLLFRIQDTKDAIYDSAVVIDDFKWLTGAVQAGTAKL